MNRVISTVVCRYRDCICQSSHNLSAVSISTQHHNKQTITKPPALASVLTNKAFQATQINTNQEVGESQAGTQTESHAFVQGGTAADLSYWEHSVVTGNPLE